tara:strand:+ start:78 stop:590 length:513 start_codon:yes stop_codon:yes gene_type:complete
MMNRKSYYSYSLISGIWRDLSVDIISIIKEYLYIHLNHRLLNRDYNLFLENIYNDKNKKNDNILLSRYGLKNKINSGYYDENTNQYVNHISLDTVLKFKINYYILGVKIYPIYDCGFNKYDRNHIILRYMKTQYSNTSLAYQKARELINNQDSLKRYIRIVMDNEEYLIN